MIFFFLMGVCCFCTRANSKFDKMSRGVPVYRRMFNTRYIIPKSPDETEIYRRDARRSTARVISPDVLSRPVESIDREDANGTAKFLSVLSRRRETKRAVDTSSWLKRGIDRREVPRSRL